MRAALSLLALAAALAACGGGGGGSSTSSGTTGTPSWSREVLPMLQASCGGSDALSCHGSTQAQGRIVYYFTEGRTAASIRASLVDQPASAPGWVYVRPGLPASSWIYEKVTSSNPGGGIGSPMPLGGTFTTPQRDLLRAWIAGGAPDN